MKKPADFSAGFFALALDYEGGILTWLNNITQSLTEVKFCYPQSSKDLRIPMQFEHIFRRCLAVAQWIERHSDESAGAGSNPVSQTTP
jgi:hypothetical protein